MPCPTCSSNRCQPVTLVDGSQACTWGEAWRHECEARAVLNMTPLAARRAYLYGTLDRWGKMSGGVNKKRGQEALKRLEDTITQIWAKRVADAKKRFAEREPGTMPKPMNDNHSKCALTSARNS